MGDVEETFDEFIVIVLCKYIVRSYRILQQSVALTKSNKLQSYVKFRIPNHCQFNLYFKHNLHKMMLY